MIHKVVSPTAGIYFSHYECFGHTTRAMAVGEIFKKRFPQGNLFFIQAGVRQPKAKLDQFGQVYSLPGAFMDRRNFKEPIRSRGPQWNKRAQLCLDIVTRRQPNLFVTELFPFGRQECRYELIPSLVKAYEQGSALWAVAGYPLVMGTDETWRDKLLRLYQKIIIFSPPDEKQFIADSFSRSEDKRKYLDFFKRYADKIIFAGYLLPQREVVNEDKGSTKASIPKGANRLTVVRGGGAVYPKLIAQAIRASDLLGKEYHVTVVAGPSTTVKEWDLFNALAGKKKIRNLDLRKAVGNYEELIAKSDVCVGMSSYHTSTMLLKHHKKSVIIPFKGYGKMPFYEQPARADMLKERLGAEILSIEELTSHRLAAAIESVSARRKNPNDVPKDWFNGAEVLAKELLKLFSR